MKLLLILSFFISQPKAQVTPLEQAPIKRHKKGAEIKFLAPSEALKSKNAFIGYLSIPPKGKVPLHRDATEEYLFVVKGGGSLWIDGKKFSIMEKDLIFMPAKAEVRYENGNKLTEVLQIFAGQGPEKKYNSKAWVRK